MSMYEYVHVCMAEYRDAKLCKIQGEGGLQR